MHWASVWGLRSRSRFWARLNLHSDYKNIARVAKAYGKRGEVVAVPADGLPPLVRAGMRVAIVPPALKGDRFHDVERVSTEDAGQLLVLSGIDDRGAAEKLVGRYVLALRADLPAHVELHDAGSLVGRTVVDDALGDLGTITEVMTGPANDVWVVVGPRGEALLPVIPTVVSEVPDDGPIAVVVPAGTEFTSTNEEGV